VHVSSLVLVAINKCHSIVNGFAFEFENHHTSWAVLVSGVAGKHSLSFLAQREPRVAF
jgi:hypothetical protein